MESLFEAITSLRTIELHAMMSDVMKKVRYERGEKRHQFVDFGWSEWDEWEATSSVFGVYV